MTAQTIGSQFPLVPMVNVKGLNSQATTDHIRIFSGIPLSSRMVFMNNPTSKSAAEKRSLPQAAWRSEFGTSRKARIGE